jgi:hypothetical protein
MSFLRSFSVAAVAAAAVVIATPLQAASISYTGTSGSFTYSDPACANGFTLSGSTLTCAGATSPPPPPNPAVNPPTGCSITANYVYNLTLPAGGGSFTLRTSCAGGDAPTSYDWVGGSITASGSTQNTILTNATVTTTYQVTPRNAGGAGNTVSLTVTVPGTTSGGTPAPSLGSCSGMNVMPTTNITWGQQASIHTQDTNGFPPDGVWVFQVTIPDGTQPTNLYAPASFAVSEFGGAPTTRQLTISKQACDFRTPDYTGVNGPFAWSNGTTATITFGVVTSDQVGQTGSTAGLVAGQTYYINVRNWSIDRNQVSCGFSSCNAIMNYNPAR